MKHLINLIREWYDYHCEVIELEKALAKYPDLQMAKHEVEWYKHLEEGTAEQIIATVREFFFWPLKWVILKKRSFTDTDELPF